MSENKKLELLDQYDDVTFALLMDEYAEEEGARLRKEFEEAQAAGEITDTPDALDEKCLQMIHRDFAKKRSKENVRKIIRITSKVAVAVMVFLGITATTIFSVDAFRIPVLNFFIERYEEYTAIRIDSMPPENATEGFVSVNGNNPLEGLLPEHYHLDTFDNSIEDHLLITYLGDNGEYVSYNEYPADDLTFYDTEGIEAENVTIKGYEALLIEKDGYRLIWFDGTNGTVHSLSATHLTYIDFWALAEIIVK